MHDVSSTCACVCVWAGVMVVTGNLIIGYSVHSEVA